MELESPPSEQDTDTDLSEVSHEYQKGLPLFRHMQRELTLFFREGCYNREASQGNP